MHFSILTENHNLSDLEGFKYTIIASLIALSVQFFLGTVIAIMRIAPIRVYNGSEWYMLNFFVISRFCSLLSFLLWTCLNWDRL